MALFQAAGLACLLTLASSGCCPLATLPDPRVMFVQSTALAGAVVDKELSQQYTKAAQEALEASEDMEMYKRAMGPWNGAVEAVERLREAVLEAADMLEAGDGPDGTPGALEWEEAAGCLASKLILVANVMARLEVDIPQSLARAIGLSAPFSGLSCAS